MIRRGRHEFYERERLLTFAALMGVGGYLGAFTYSIRGGVFCNAQTANFVLLAMAIGNHDLLQAVYLLIPISAYFLGAVISEYFRTAVRFIGPLRWDTWLIICEIIVTVILGLLPESAPYQITQVAVNFICSMQFNTFRVAEGTPMATTFCTNHLRSAGAQFYMWLRRGHRLNLMRCLQRLGMIGSFVFFGIISTVLCRFFLGRAIWGATALLIVIFADLIYADLVTEKKVKVFMKG